MCELLEAPAFQNDQNYRLRGWTAGGTKNALYMASNTPNAEIKLNPFLHIFTNLANRLSNEHAKQMLQYFNAQSKILFTYVLKCSQKYCYYLADRL
jgi:hypothetical protein